MLWILVLVVSGISPLIGRNLKGRGVHVLVLGEKGKDSTEVDAQTSYIHNSYKQCNVHVSGIGVHAQLSASQSLNSCTAIVAFYPGTT